MPPMCAKCTFEGELHDAKPKSLSLVSPDNYIEGMGTHNARTLPIIPTVGSHE